MPSLLVPAINVSNAIDLSGNTYLTLAQADTYFDNRPGSTGWYGVTSDNKERALLTAVTLLDEARIWIGAPVREDQPLAWPRVAIRPSERRARRLIRTGFETLTGATGGLYDARSRFWASNVIPKPIKDAQCEIALALLDADYNLAPNEASIKSFSADGLSVEFDTPQKRTELPVLVSRLLAPMSMGGVELLRG